MSASTPQHATVQEVKSADPNKMIFDGHKADVYINTNQLGGNHFLVRVTTPSGQPKLIAIHL